MKHFLSVFLCLLLLSFTVRAQRPCGSTAYRQQVSENDQRSSISPIKTETAEASETTVTPSHPIIRIPVVVHILYNNDHQNISDAQVRSQITVLNQDFRKLNADTAYIPAVFRQFAADCSIEFQLATTDPSGRATRGIVRQPTHVRAFGLDETIKSSAYGGSNAWDGNSYLNIWVAPLSKGIIGYASAPGTRKELDGVVISYTAFGTTGTAQAPYNKGRTATHEIGHWLGLRHIWGDSDCGNDYIDDTPPQSEGTRGCPSGQITSCNNGSNGNMYMNFMDFTDDACINMFTHGQKALMRSLFAAHGKRASLLQSGAFKHPVQPETPEEGRLPGATALKIYPNPAGSSIQVSSSQPLEGQPVIIQDHSGRVVLRTLVQPDGKISLSNLQSGSYFLKIGPGRVAKLFKAN